MEKQTGKPIKSIRTDNGREYVNRELKNFLHKAGIRHQQTVPYSPEQNGLAERMNRTIVERAKSMMFDAELPKKYWAEAVATAVYLINRSPASGIDGRTPEEMWIGQSPNLKHLRVFGCKAMAQIFKERWQKWDSNANELIFVGYEDNVKGYRLMDLRTECVVKRRDVVFLEEVCSEKVREPEEMRGTFDITFDGEDENNKDEAKEVSDESDLSNASIDTVRETSESEYATDCGGNGLTSDEDTLIEDDQLPQAADHLTPEGLKRSTRVRRLINMSYYVTYLAAARDTDKPQTVEDAICGANCDLWKRAMEEEKKSLEKNETRTLVDLPPNRKALDTKWVFRTKRDSSGKIERYKARLVVRGCNQTEGIDY